MIDPKEVKIRVREELLQIEPHKEGIDEVVVRCPLCGDSIKSQFSTHLHIKVDVDDNEMPLIYHCFRCDESGILNSDMLRELGIYDITLSSKVRTYNKVAMKSLEKKGFTKYADKVNIQLPYPQNLELAELKKKYFEERLGVSVTIEQLVALKVCFNFADFLRANNVDKLTVSREMLKFLHYNYIGFISTNNDFIQFRDISGTAKYRYFNYDIFKSIDKSRNFYSIPNKIDLMTTEDIHIVLAEGVFDILGAFFNIFDCKVSNMIYSAVCGCGYASVLKYYLRKGITGKNVHVIIISDNDREPSFYSALYEETRDWVGSFTLYYNSKSKDVGVPKDKIELIEKKIPKKKYN